jgi:hypothetical protein
MTTYAPIIGRSLLVAAKSMGQSVLSIVQWLERQEWWNPASKKPTPPPVTKRLAAQSWASHPRLRKPMHSPTPTGRFY